MKLIALAALLPVTCSLSTTLAQSLNIDFGITGTVPSDSYAAAGLAGRWNAIGEIPQGPPLLFGLDGAPTIVALFIDFGGSPVEHNDPATTGDDERLFDDFLFGLGDVPRRFRFFNLTAGWYRVITYGWTPGAPGETTGVFIDGQLDDYQVAGGIWPGHPVQGITHTIHYTSVIDSPLNIVTGGGTFGDSGNVNGIQLVRLGPPCLADWNHDGLMNSADFFEFTADFFNANADFNRNGATTSADFFDFLTAFFAGC